MIRKERLGAADDRVDVAEEARSAGRRRRKAA
jgi:hypothetical protein